MKIIFYLLMAVAAPVAFDEVLNEHVQRDLSLYFEREGRLEAVEDGQSIAGLSGRTCVVKFEKRSNDEAIIKFHDRSEEGGLPLGLDFVVQSERGGVSERQVSGAGIEYRNNFENTMGYVGTPYCGKLGPSPFSSLTVQNKFWIDHGRLELQTIYKCGAFSPRRGTHQLLLSCQF